MSFKKGMSNAWKTAESIMETKKWQLNLKNKSPVSFERGVSVECWSPNYGFKEGEQDVKK